MLEYEELRLEFENLKPQVADLAKAMNLEAISKEAADLEDQSAQPGFWDDAEASQKIMQKVGALKNKIASFKKLEENVDDVLTMIELAEEEEDASMLPEIKELAEETKGMLEEQKLIILLSGEYDSKNAILTFHAGAGGTEAQDWVEMLYRMYNRWAERHHFKVELLDYLDGEEAGIKSASILIKGENSYGFLKSENGVHRLVRVSPCDSSGRRHTSFASLEVMPEIDEDTNVDIRLRILKWRFTVPAAQVVRRSTRPAPQFALSTSRQALYALARHSAVSFKTANMQCVCLNQS